MFENSSFVVLFISNSKIAISAFSNFGSLFNALQVANEFEFENRPSLTCRDHARRSAHTA